ncbi:MAG: hypothetical protein LBU14_05015 [Candidatus Peribacteria bacterium]|jgi:hypothetical protein|nr:hypothetical protein [Candidatus Peribacteria bacterium]
MLVQTLFQVIANGVHFLYTHNCSTHQNAHKYKSELVLFIIYGVKTYSSYGFILSQMTTSPLGHNSIAQS